MIHSEHGSTCYEVTNQLQFRAQVPWLSQVSKRLQETLELSQDLLDKVKLIKLIINNDIMVFIGAYYNYCK